MRTTPPKKFDQKSPLAFVLAALVVGIPVDAMSPPLAFTVDPTTRSYTITEDSRPVLTYRFGEVPLPAGVEAHRFRQGPVSYDGAYFTDGSRFGGERSNYIHPLFGFQGEPLTVDYPKDHLHQRGIWWSWCEVRWHAKIGDLWAVCKIRAYPVEITRMEVTGGYAVLQAVNVWRYDDDPTDVVKETVTIRAHRMTGEPGTKTRAVEVDVRMEALVDGVAITGRQKVEYGGYSGMSVRLNSAVQEFSLRVVHPYPDSWRGDTLAIAERVRDVAEHGNAAWLALFGRFPTPGVAQPGFTTLMMFEATETPLYPNNFRYYKSTATSLAFPGTAVVSLARKTPLDYRTRFVIREGKTTIQEEKALWRAYQQ